MFSNIDIKSRVRKRIQTNGHRSSVTVRQERRTLLGCDEKETMRIVKHLGYIASGFRSTTAYNYYITSRDHTASQCRRMTRYHSEKRMR
ncbi:hypothetical protein H9L39_15673 [Fusarium oxysporum f. sp. albedinis]|nr:hypothetical protein H9L39_15673 [Fusarium oxysporum f. sp. albedinis]